MNEKDRIMRSIGLKMSIFMGITMSFFLSLIGTGTSGHFSIPAWFLSFLISTVISLLIGFIVPMKKVNDQITSKLGLHPGQFSTRLVETLISDLIYTPLITFCMVFFAYKMAVSHGAQLSFLPMFLSSLVICLVAGFLLIFIFTPFYMALITKNLPKPSDKKD